MPQDKPSQFPAMVNSLADSDYLLLSQRDTNTNLWVSVKCTVGAFKAYLYDLIIEGHIDDANIGDTLTGSYTVNNPPGITTFSLDSGSLPDGVALNADGTYTGETTTGGFYSWVVKAQDTYGRTAYLSDNMQVAYSSGYVMPSALLGSAAQASSVMIRRGLWMLVMAEFNAIDGTVGLYVNNEFVGAVASSEVSPEVDIVVGGSRFDDNAYQTWRGLIWGAGVINGGLSDAERNVIWNNGLGNRFEDISASGDSAAVSLWGKLIHAWQLDNSSFVDQKGNKDLTQGGTVVIEGSSKFGNCARFNRNGRLVALGSGTQGIEDLNHSIYFAWIYADVISSDSFPNVICRYNGGGVNKGIRCYWAS